MEILMIGNGFDLEHGLPTKYTDFLNFVYRFNFACINVHRKPSKASEIKDEYLKHIFNSQESPETNVGEMLHEYLKDNIWIEHFQNAYRKHLKNKENWIDFESEISEIVQVVDKLYHTYMDVDDEFYDTKIQNCKKRLPDGFLGYLSPKNEIGNLISKMLLDLNRLIGALEIYIFDYIDNWERIECYNPDIDAIHPDAILSFNYSGTWEKLYAYNRANVRYCFIHGKAQSMSYTFCMEECINKNQMVLGIDEYLPDDRKDKEVEFIAFKKYYQRIYKKTGNEYKSWLAEIDRQRKEGKNQDNRLYIFGHSLDVTDGDILKELIEHDGIKTIIFYKDKARLGQQIANLVKVLGSEKIIQYVYGNNPIIEFRQQKNREKIHGSTFEIVCDMVKFDHFHKYKGEDLENLILKFEEKIEEKDLEYFCSQKTVISLYDVLQRHGLGKKYEKQLLGIADNLRKTESMDKEPIQFRYDNWAYQDYDNSWGCDERTRSFIAIVNGRNRVNFTVSDSRAEAISWDDIMENYWKIADGCEDIGRERYIETLKDILSMHKNPYGNMEDMWRLLIKLSRGVADKISRETLKELIQDTESSWEVCNYTYLLHEIEEYDYFSEMEKNMPGYFE